MIILLLLEILDPFACRLPLVEGRALVVQPLNFALLIYPALVVVA